MSFKSKINTSKILKSLGKVGSDTTTFAAQNAVKQYSNLKSDAIFSSKLNKKDDLLLIRKLVPNNVTGAGSGVPYCAPCWSPELKMFVALGNTSNYGAYSYDGINWVTAAFSSTNGYGWDRISWSAELGKFIGCEVNSGYNVDVHKMVYSTDGINWTAYNPTSSPAGINLAILGSVNWVSYLGMYILCLTVGSPKLGYSYNGIDYFVGDISGYVVGASNWVSSAWSPELKMLVAVAGGTAQNLTSAYSYDGINWFGSTSTGNNSWKNVVWNPRYKMFSALGSYYSMYSYDGINWVAGSSPNIVANTGCGIFPSGIQVTKGSISINGKDWFLPSNLSSLGAASFGYSPELGIMTSVGYRFWPSLKEL